MRQYESQRGWEHYKNKVFLTNHTGMNSQRLFQQVQCSHRSLSHGVWGPSAKKGSGYKLQSHTEAISN